MSVAEDTVSQPDVENTVYNFEDYADMIRRLNASGELDCGYQHAREMQEFATRPLAERTHVVCPTYWDTVLCWPSTPAGTAAVMHCMEELNGVKYDVTQNATRFCHINGTWDNYTDYSQCKHIKILPENDYLAGTEVPSIIYYIGYTLSLVALGLAVWVFLYFKDLRCLRNTIHINLMCTYMMAALMWILTLTLQLTATPDNTSCVFLVILLHYFSLTNFFWMLVEGLYLYMLVVETFTRKNIKLRVYLLLGWVAPAIFIMAWAIVRSTVPQVAADDESISLIIGNNPHCSWLGEQVYDWLYQAPACVVLVVNLLFLFRIMWVLITKLRSANTLETQQYRKASKALLVLIPLLGITYLLVIMGPTEGISRHIFDIARAVLLSTQGFTVALFYCFLNTEVQNTLRHHIERWKTARSLGGGSRRNYSKEWSPRSRTESIRLNSLYSQPLSQHGYKKRESTASETTTTTLLGSSQPQTQTTQLNNKCAAGNSQRQSISPFLQPGITENDI